jgi:hypothetical protein
LKRRRLLTQKAFVLSITCSTLGATITGVLVAESIEMKPITRRGIGCEPAKLESPPRMKLVAFVVCR